MATYIETFDHEPRVKTRTTIQTDRPRAHVTYEVLVDDTVVWTKVEPIGHRIKYRELTAREQDAEAVRQIDRLTRSKEATT